jgi:gliding motility-associated-like protein
MKHLYNRLTLLLLMMMPMAANATHIVGGELNYKHLGNNDYEIRLTVYRDCWNGVPPFDSLASLGVFDVNNNLVTSILMPFLGLDTLPPTINNPCYQAPTNVCYEVTTYIDTINLPPIPGGYQLAYQRCCRNGTILNIIAPGNTGATYYATVPDTALVVLNSNPVFKFWPPPFICANLPFTFDHSAIDYDGDSLVYELFTPLDGADVSNPMPQPPYNPPYPLINWQSPYNAANMMGGTPLTIDPQTGELTAIPNTLGQFVVGMRVKEYRNGVFISQTQRDFQFNVVDCPNYIVSAAQVPNVICGLNSVTFTNNSTGASSYFWDFGDNTITTDTSSQVSPVYTYPDTGLYQVTLIVYAAIDSACNDTSIIPVNITSAYTSDFSYASDPCIGTNEYVFTSNTATISNVTPSWYWQFGDGDTAMSMNPTHTYASAGTYVITLISTIPNSLNCYDTVSHTVTFIPNPELFVPNSFTPNGDNRNDLFRVRGKAFDNFYFTVYNRWGQKVFETYDQNVGWDGTYNGMAADPGVFAWYLKASCEGGEEIIQKGNVTLLK